MRILFTLLNCVVGFRKYQSSFRHLDKIDNIFEKLSNFEQLPTFSKGQILQQVTVPPKFRNSPAASSFILPKNSLRSSFLQLAGSAKREALEYANQQKSGIVDFVGVCHDFLILATETNSGSLNDCWTHCMKNMEFCTQVHWVQGNCFLGAGVSGPRGGKEEISRGICRSLTDLGFLELVRGERDALSTATFVSSLTEKTKSDIVETVIPAISQFSTFPLTLSAFTILPSEIKYTLVQPLSDSGSMFATPSFLFCQSACLNSDWCNVVAWLDGEICQLALKAISGDTVQSDCRGMNCLANIGGTEDVILAEKDEMFTVVNSVSGSTSSISNTFDCKCSGEEICLTECRRKSQRACIQLCSEKENCKFVSVGFQEFVEIQNPVNETATIVVSPQGGVDVIAPPRPVIVTDKVECRVSGNLFNAGKGKLYAHKNSPAISRSFATTFLQSEIKSEAFHSFPGSCDIFHANLTVAGVSQFSAESADECWALCEAYSPSCSQIMYHALTSMCVLGDGIASNYVSSPDGTVCRSRSDSRSPSGLSGMLLVDSVNGQTVKNRWFPSSQARGVASLEACQSLTKLGNFNHGGYVSCDGVLNACLTQPTHPDCAICQLSQNGGVCRMQALKESPETNIPCIGNCQFFESGIQGFQLKIGKSSLPSSPIGQLCYVNPSPSMPQITKQANGFCGFQTSSLSACQSVCQQAAGCVGGLYTDKQGLKLCSLATAISGNSTICSTGGVNCAWFELAGLGNVLPLTVTGTNLADANRQSIAPQAGMNFGRCAVFKALDVFKAGPPSVFALKPLTACANLCDLTPNCRSWQVAGAATAGSSCSVSEEGNMAGCSQITCSLSSVITGTFPAQPGDESSACFSYTANPYLASLAPASMLGVNLGVPSYYLSNARVRKFGWSDVINQNRLSLTQTLEDCQSGCKAQGSDVCAGGTWQVCSSVESGCVDSDNNALLAATVPNSELFATCEACSAVNVSISQQSVAFPSSWGVCKYSRTVKENAQKCQPEPCYAFEGGDDEFIILSVSKSPFIDSDGIVISNLLMGAGYTKSASLNDCESICHRTNGCLYGHYEPMTNGYGNCFLSGQQLQTLEEGVYTLSETNFCLTQNCVVFQKVQPPSNNA